MTGMDSTKASGALGEYQMGWTDERVELLKKLWADGLSASQIAAELGGITRNAVIGKVHRLGLAGRATPKLTSTPPWVAPVCSAWRTRSWCSGAMRPARLHSTGGMTWSADAMR